MMLSKTTKHPISKNTEKQNSQKKDYFNVDKKMEKGMTKKPKTSAPLIIKKTSEVPT